MTLLPNSFKVQINSIGPVYINSKYVLVQWSFHIEYLAFFNECTAVIKTHVVASVCVRIIYVIVIWIVKL